MIEENLISSTPNEEEPLVPFLDDVTKQRLEYAKQLTSFVDRMHPGGVISINAGWGEGKSWFGRNWAKYLKDEGYKVAQINAFEHDYIEEPFVAISSELCSVFDEGMIQKFLPAASTALTIITPIVSAAAKVKIALIGAGIVSASPPSNAQSVMASTNHVANEVGGLIGKSGEWAKNQIESFRNDKKSLHEFKDVLKSIVAPTKNYQKPYVVIIDELDRCKPDFAILLLERVKHLFEIPNLVFVLLVNVDQLEKAVKGAYGAEIDAENYLQKFITLPLSLPKSQSFHDTAGINHFRDYLIKKLVGVNGNEESWLPLIKKYASMFDFTLRDYERAASLIFMGGFPPCGATAFLICLRIRNKAWFAGVRRKEIGQVNDLVAFIRRKYPKADSENDILSALKLIGEWQSGAPFSEGDFLPHAFNQNPHDLLAHILAAIETGSIILDR